MPPYVWTISMVIPRGMGMEVNDPTFLRSSFLSLLQTESSRAGRAGGGDEAIVREGHFFVLA